MKANETESSKEINNLIKEVSEFQRMNNEKENAAQILDQEIKQSTSKLEQIEEEKIARLRQAAIAINLMHAIHYIICIPTYVLHSLSLTLCIRINLHYFYAELKRFESMESMLSEHFIFSGTLEPKFIHLDLSQEVTNLTQEEYHITVGMLPKTSFKLLKLKNNQ